jgi:mono/diheme cytochrome c family protein
LGEIIITILRRNNVMAIRNIFFAAICGLLLSITLYIAPVAAESKFPKGLLKGEALFNKNCALCHGQAGTGTNSGPPLVHKIYEPNHHADEAFYRAVQNGVIAHHWRFGNMPPLPNLNRDTIEHIIQYIRWLQREAGIF